MVQPVVRNCVGADQQLQAEHAMSEILERERAHSFAGFGRSLRPDALSNAEQKRAGAGCRI